MSNLKYLLPDNLSDFREMYTAIKFARRQDCLEKLKNPVQVSDLYKSPLQFNLSQLFQMDFITLIRKFKHQCETCDEVAHIICLYCGQKLCHRCFTENSVEKHALQCQRNGVYYFLERNIIFFTEDADHCYYTGGPYLSDDNEDDCQRIKRVPLYLNGELLNNLMRHLLYRLEYKADKSKGITL